MPIGLIRAITTKVVKTGPAGPTGKIEGSDQDRSGPTGKPDNFQNPG